MPHYSGTGSGSAHKGHFPSKGIDSDATDIAPDLQIVTIDKARSGRARVVAYVMDSESLDRMVNTQRTLTCDGDYVSRSH